MNKFLFFSTLLLAGAISALPATNDKRLIKTSADKEAVWMTEGEIWDKLILKHANFIDITDHVNDYPKLTQEDVYTKAIPSAPRFQNAVRGVITGYNSTRVRSFVEHFSSYHNRYYQAATGTQSQQWLYGQVLESLNFYVGSYEINEVSHSWQQKSIVARIHGTDPALRSETVIIGAHQDSINILSPTLSAPGADDNASGSVVVLETLRCIVASGFIPKRTIEFHWYAAEEVGLRGSQDIARSFQQAGKVVAAMVNFDVPGYHVNGVDNIGIYTDNTNAELNAFLRLLVDEYCVYGWTNRVCGYGCSDHASWTNFGFAAAMPAEVTLHPQMHTPNDNLANVGFTQINEFVKLSIGFVVEISEPVFP